MDKIRICLFCNYRWHRVFASQRQGAHPRKMRATMQRSDCVPPSVKEVKIYV